MLYLFSNRLINMIVHDRGRNKYIKPILKVKETSSSQKTSQG